MENITDKIALTIEYMESADIQENIINLDNEVAALLQRINELQDKRKELEMAFRYSLSEADYLLYTSSALHSLLKVLLAENCIKSFTIKATKEHIDILRQASLLGKILFDNYNDNSEGAFDNYKKEEAIFLNLVKAL